MNRTIYVSKNNEYPDSCPTLTDALDAAAHIGGAVTIRIAPGVYREKVEISQNGLTIEGLGKTPGDVVLTYDDFAFDEMADGTKRGTFRSYSVLIDASGITVKNLTIENNSGDENTHGQAIALYAEGDRLLFENVRLLGRQDTLFTGPLPPKELQPNGFIGPKQFAPRINGRQYYKDCYICGNVDFVFGSATAVFEHCKLESLLHKQDAGAVQGYVAAPSSPEGQTYGYLFLDCDFTSKECPPHSCYLARPWREYAKAVFIRCRIGAHIRSDGFHDWNKPAFHEHGLFAVYENVSVSPDGQPLGAFTPSAPFAVTLPQEEADFYQNIKEIFR